MSAVPAQTPPNQPPATPLVPEPSSAKPAPATIRAILDLPPDEADRSRPVEVEGVVTYYDPKWDTLFVQDATAGIYVFPPPEPRPRIQSGQKVRIRGTTIRAQPSNAIRQESLMLLGAGALPIPSRISATQLLRGDFDSQWVEFEAVVREWVFRYQRMEMELSVDGFRVYADSPRTPGRDPATNLVHSRVLVRGVASRVSDREGRSTGTRVFVPGPESYQILAPPSDDPFLLPLVRIHDITGPNANVPSDARRRIAGFVLSAGQEELVIQDATAGMRVRLQWNKPINDPDGYASARPEVPSLVVGDAVEAVGYVTRLVNPPHLIDAYVRKGFANPPQEPIPPTRIVVSDVLEGHPLHVLAEIDATVVDDIATPESTNNVPFHRWLLTSDSKAFEAVLPSQGNPSSLLPGDRQLRLRGFIEPKPRGPELPPEFQFRMRSPDDVVVRPFAPVGRSREILRPLLVSAAVILLLLGWALFLWRETGAQRALNRDLEARIQKRTAELIEANRHLEEQISEQQRVKSRLEESETRTRAILQHSPEGIVVVDPATNVFVEVNEAAALLFSSNPKDLVGRSPVDLSPVRQANGSLSKDSAAQHLRRTLGGGSHRFEWMHRDVEGRDFPCEVNLALMPRDGRMFVIGTITDITARKRADSIMKAIYEISEAANHSEDLPGLYSRIHAVIRQLMNAENLYIANYDTQKNVISFPYYVDEMDPRPPNRPLGRGFTEYVLRTGRPLLADATVRAELAQSKECHPIGSPAALWLGAPLALRGRAFGVIAIQEYHNPEAFGAEEKDVLGFVAEQIAIAIDRRRAIDELRASEARLRESEERFSKAFHNSQGALAIVSLDTGQYLDVNEGFVRTYGYSRDEALGSTSIDLNLWLDTTHRDRLFECLRTAGSFRNEETVMRRRDGQILTTVESADVIEIGGKRCVIVFALDITDRKRAETELSHALDQERELSQLKSSFVSLVSHEFRTPLEVILSSAEILERYHDRLATEQRARQLRAITTSVRRMAQMMNEVLLLGRFDAGRMEFNPATIDLPAFCQRITDDIAAATDHRCRIELDIRGDTEGAAGDEALLGHIFTNLLSNAVKYSPSGSQVSFQIERRGSDAVFAITDQGLGIPEADRARLFSAFHRGSNVGQVPGSGLGLVIVRRCTDLHHGRLRFESTPGSGTMFEIQIPLWRSTDAASTTSLFPS